MEEAARALAATKGLEWNTLSPSERKFILSNLRTVLEALREPDHAMVEAGAEIIRNVRQGESDAAYLNDATNAWRYMIDAARGSLR